MKKLEIESMKSLQSFPQEIETLVAESGLEYIDAVLHYCEVNNLDIETVASIIKSSSKIKGKIQLEAESLNILPKTSKLPI